MIDAILSRPLAYRIWMAPFAARKLGPLLAHNDLRSIRRVLDVGCGPGTNAAVFNHADYVGVDLNERYIQAARRRYGRDFLVADVCSDALPMGQGFDCVLANSLFHHLDLPSSRTLLRRLSELVTPDGHVHLVDLVLPEGRSIARAIARADRGKFARSIAEWKALFAESFETVLLEPFRLTALGVSLWELVYFKGRARAGSSATGDASVHRS